jgi:hypothetical protein
MKLLEYFIPAVAIAIAITIRGSGAWSVDRLLTRGAAPAN